MAAAAAASGVARSQPAIDSSAAESWPATSNADSETPLAKSHRNKKPRQCLSRFAIFAIATASVAIIALALGFGLGFGLGHSSKRKGPIIQLDFAKYRGNYLNNGVSEFLGMRFAKAPTGDLRWHAPQLPDNETETQDANQFKPVCLPDLFMPQQNTTEFIDEDCLFVNVWAPTNATPEQKLPVLVFIQGGGYDQNANANWNGSDLVQTSDNNLVFVNFNYRVGLWGFLGGDQVREDGDLNVGLLDQRFLLEWVQTHISAFGGDPDHVVIQGVSAGAGSVALHLAAYGGRNDGLFVGAIAESMFHPAYPKVSDQNEQLQRVVDAVGCSNETHPIQCLRGKDLDDLQSLDILAPFPGHQEPPRFYWTPSVDGEIISDLPYNSFKDGKVIKVPLLFGTCTNEGSEFAPNASTILEVEDFFLNNYPKLNSSTAKDIMSLYPKLPALPHHRAWFPSASQAYGEATFICPSNIFLNLMSETYSASSSSAPIWSYRFNVLDEQNVADGLGVPHVFETTAVFGDGAFPNVLTAKSWETYNAAIIPITMNYWLSFARTLDPNTHKFAGAPDWEKWGNTQQRLVLQTGKTGSSVMEKVDSGQQKRCEYWERLGPSIDQ